MTQEQEQKVTEQKAGNGGDEHLRREIVGSGGLGQYTAEDVHSDNNQDPPASH